MIRGLVWLQEISTGGDLSILKFFLLLADAGGTNCVRKLLAAKRSRFTFSNLRVFSLI